MNTKFDLTLMNNCVEESKRKEGIDKKWQDLHQTIKKR